MFDRVQYLRDCGISYRFIGPVGSLFQWPGWQVEVGFSHVWLHDAGIGCVSQRTGRDCLAINRRPHLVVDLLPVASNGNEATFRTSPVVGRGGQSHDGVLVDIQSTPVFWCDYRTGSSSGIATDLVGCSTVVCGGRPGDERSVFTWLFLGA